MISSQAQSFLSAVLLGFAVSATGQAAPASAPTANSAAGAQGAMAQIQVPPLDVISVKPNKLGASGGMSWGPTPDGVMGKNIPVHLMLVEAYHLSENQIIDEPEWAKSEHFDVNGKVTGPDAAAVAKLTPEQKRVYFEQVLKERFGLVTHHETRELPEYALVAAKGGAKIEDGKPDPNAAPEMKKGSGWYRMNLGGPVESVEFAGAQIDPLLLILSNVTGRTVVDKTGLTGKYFFTLKFKSAVEQVGADDAADSAPDLFTAIQEQLGLKLKPVKGPVDVLVIDHLERPGEN